MASASADTSIIVYDLFSDSAMFKLLGHSDVITGLDILQMQDPIKGNINSYLLSGSKDGFMKLWDLTQQKCILNVSDQYISKIERFTIIEELKIIAVGSNDSNIRIFQIQFNSETKSIEVILKSLLRKESSKRVIDL